MSAPKVKKSRNKTPPDQPVAGPSNDKKDNPSRRGRKLDFTAHKPLSGKRFYLELTGPRRKQEFAKLKADVEELGGVVEQFLSKDLACVISDRTEAKDGFDKITKGVPSGTSPAVSTPSPFHQNREVTPGAADSPSNVAKDSTIITRGKAIVQKATKSQMYGTTDVLTNAKKLMIPIKHLDVLSKYLSREKEKLKLNSKDKKKSSKDKLAIKSKERKLTKPYLKVEDVSRRFRPMSKEFGTWPRILLDTRKGSCPYDPKTRNESNPQGAERTQDKQDPSQRTPDLRVKEVSKSQSLSRKAISKAAKQKEVTANKTSKRVKKGFCEFCSVKYSNLEKHLETDKHKQFVGETNNYTSLDTMIAQGPNLVRFLEDCAKFSNVAPQSSTSEDDDYDSSAEDEVLLLTESPKEGHRKSKKRDKKEKEPSAFTRRKILANSPNEAVRNGQSAEEPVPRVDPAQRTTAQDEKEKEVENNTAKSFPHDSSQQRKPGDPMDLLRVIEEGELAGEGKKKSPTDNRKFGINGGDGEAMPLNNLPNTDLTSPEVSTGSDGKKGRGRKRRGRLSLQVRDGRTLVSRKRTPNKNGAIQESGDGVQEGGVAQEGHEASTVLRGVAGEEEPVVPEGQEVAITRIRREETLQEVIREEARETMAAMGSPHAVKPQTNGTETGQSGSRTVLKTVDDAIPLLETPSTRLAKRGSQAVNSPESARQTRTRKRLRTSALDTDSDDVFTSNQTTPVSQVPVKSKVGLGKDGDSERPKRKSRRSHVDAPPRKVRGSSARVENNNVESLEVGRNSGSPCIREAQPRVPAPHDVSHNSSDDFQQVLSPKPGSAKSSGKKRQRRSRNEDLNNSNQDSPALDPRNNRSLRSHTSTSRLQTAESNNSASVLHKSHPGRVSNRKKDLLTNANKCEETQSNEQPQFRETSQQIAGDAKGPVVANDIHGKQNSKSDSEHSKHKEQGNPKIRIEPADSSSEHQGDQQKNGMASSQAEQSLELVFRSDLGAEESSFLGFSQEEINQTANRSELFQQQHLDKAALSVYCIPSSEPCPDDDQSSQGSTDFTIGLVLQKVDNFPSEGSEWEEQVTGFMKRLDTQLEIKRRRESELSTLPSPNFHKSLFERQKENENILPGVLEDFGPEPMSDDEDNQVFLETNENVPTHDTGKKSSARRRSARISDSFNFRRATRSTPKDDFSYSGMCTSPSKKKRSISISKKAIASGDKKTEAKSPVALRELSSNQLVNSPQKNADTVQYSSPKSIKRNLMNTPKSPIMKHIVLPPGTPVAEQEEIVNNYVHDDSESEIVFPKFSSPAQKGAIFSPVKHRVKPKRFRPRHHSMPYLGHRDVQSSPLRPSNRHDLVSFAFPPLTSRKSLFMKGRVKRINISSPRKRSKSASSSPSSKSSQFLTFLNELKAGLSPTFYTFKKPHFSLRILQPSAVRRHYHSRSNMSRSLLALNLCLPSNAELRIYEFHDDDSMEDDDLDVTPIGNDVLRKELHDQYTQTPTSSRKRRSLRSHRILDEKGKTRSSPNPASKTKNVKEVEHESSRKGKRNVKIQASSPDIDSIFDMPAGYFM